MCLLAAVFRIPLLATGSTVTMPVGKQLLSGYESNDYVINVVIKATDRIGSSTWLWMNATVSKTSKTRITPTSVFNFCFKACFTSPVQSRRPFTCMFRLGKHSTCICHASYCDVINVKSGQCSYNFGQSKCRQRAGQYPGVWRCA